MRICCKILAINILCACLVYAQEAPVSTNTVKSSLQFSTDRSEQMRIEFLLDAAKAYSAEQNLPAAIDAYEQILVLDPESKEAAYFLSLACIQAKDYEKAEELLLVLIDNHPDDFTLLNNLAWIYATAEGSTIRNSKKAILYAQKAMVMAPNDYHIWSTLAEAHYSAGDYEKAFRAINHMAALAARYGTDLTEASIESYNEQILKCKRALDTAEALKEDAAEDVEEE